MVVEGYSNAMAGAQLWLLRSSATRKAQRADVVDFVVEQNGRWRGMTGRGVILPKIKDRGDLGNDETKR